MSGETPGKDTVETPYIVPWRKALIGRAGRRTLQSKGRGITDKDGITGDRPPASASLPCSVPKVLIVVRIHEVQLPKNKNMQNQPLKLNISLDKTTPIFCEKCNGQAFQSAILLRKASKFLTGTPQDGLIPIETFVCASCGHVNEEFLPKELQNDVQ